MKYDLGGYTSALTTSMAAEFFWAIFVIGIAVAVLVIGRRPRRRKRIWTYDRPSPSHTTSRPAELYRSSSASTRSTISPESPR
jgi:hypothetical protein